MSAVYTDGNFNSLTVSGPPRYSFPLQDEGNYYARMIEQDYTALPGALAGNPSVGARETVTNLLLYSEDFTNAVWVASNVSVTANSVVDPTGATTADLISTTGDNPYIFQDYTPTGNEASVFGVWMRSATGSSFTLDLFAYDSSPNTLLAQKTVTVLPTWSFVCLPFTAVDASGHYVVIGSGGTWANGNHLYAWGASIVESSAHNAYVPTTNVAANYASSPPVYPNWPSAYLVNQSDGSITGGGAAAVTLTFAELPDATTVYTTTDVNKPTFVEAGGASDANYGVLDSLAVQQSSGTVESYSSYRLLGGDNEIWGPMQSGSGLGAVATAGTFTITYKTSTTAAIAYNANNATINSAINGLADIIADGITVSSSATMSAQGYVSVVISAGSFGNNVLSMDASGLTAATTTTYTTGGSANQTIGLAYLLTKTAHGLTHSGGLLVRSSFIAAYYVVPTALWGVENANTISLARAVSGETFGQKFRDYTPGTDTLRSRVVTDYYLPGVSSGITTAADIPVPNVVTSPAALLDSILAGGTGWTDYEVQDLAVWMGPIYKQSVTQVNFDDL